ncbi:[FeFe] hydrogenase H-cluster radical SAM maturase HydE [Bacteroides sp. 51]|uniref:[FeFe] hydrogenase H-cluster radical SAM maturase HydE n=1 Tax=Bacteroides sp. 51 TaxID=2302938 RepID=UPI0013D85053|nr:[FeFe] hydrogenase H-cluster radical SAM maturase HydE [Bacteroides sp. 51]NDV84863.1 [FeFe] hydrogenase H-cluster radical SAM maturase HydE [Bacteroides sp. 51]
MKNLVDRLRREKHLEPEEYLRLLTSVNEDLLSYINESAREVSVAHFGRAIYARGLIEITNHCRNNCYYCGIRCGNASLERYRLSMDQILACCETGNRLGLKTFVLQGGEDPCMNEEFIVALVAAIRSRFPDHAITLSLGEHSEEAYKRFFAAGANRYLLRHETANPVHYAFLHPAQMSHQKRMGCLRVLKGIGYQTGAGFMVGSPGQRLENLVEDLLFLRELRPEMIGIGPFIPQKDTPFASEPAGSVDMTLMLISILRLMFPEVLLPATTALATLTHGYEQGILSGANVVMPNLTPKGYREKYIIYDNKAAATCRNEVSMQAATCRSEVSMQENEYNEVKEQVESIGYYISDARGDYKTK